MHPKCVGANINCVIERLRNQKTKLGLVEVSMPAVKICRKANEEIKNK
jgi:hypothetical protein